MLNRYLVLLAVSLTSWSGVYAATVDVDNCTLAVCKQAQRKLDARIKILEAATTPAFLDMVSTKNLNAYPVDSPCGVSHDCIRGHTRLSKEYARVSAAIFHG